MIELKICMGTACHLRGSREVIERLQELITLHNIKEQVDMSGKFCLGKCENTGVSISVNDDAFDLSACDTDDFFEKEILGRLKK